MGILKDFKSIYTKQWDLNFSQSYSNAKLKLPELANLLQLTAASHADTGGLGFADLAVNDQSWVLSRIRIEIDKLPVWSNIVDIKTWIEELKGFKSTRNFEVAYNGEKYVGATSLWAIFNMSKRRPEAMLIDNSHVECFPEVHATSQAVDRVETDFEAIESFVYQVQFSDLDIVRHANNTKYLEWCLNHVDPAIILEDKIKVIEMNFLKEVGYKEEIRIEKGLMDGVILFRIMKEGKVCFACRFELR